VYSLILLKSEEEGQLTVITAVIDDEELEQILIQDKKGGIL
jgi:hypothetical protein